jgi:polar amino acid transport system substrate-binding protein
MKGIVLFASLALAACAMPNQAPDSLRAQFAPTGTLRAAVNYGNIVIAQKDPAGGDPRGVGPELAREIARRLGVPIQYVAYDTAGKVADAVKQGAWDIAFLAVDPERANEIAFSAPYVQIEGTYMVRADSPLGAIADFDREGIRISVGLKTAYDLYLTRNIRHARLIRSATSQAAIDEFAAGKADAVAGVKNTLVAAAAGKPGLRVVDGNFMVIGQASGVPRAREASARYLREFIEEAKASGFVARALRQSGVTDATVAPAAK